MTSLRRAWRLIVSAPARGSRNMAVDEAILEAVASGLSRPTLRLYAWSPPCLSLGHAQPTRDVDRPRLAALGWDLVRRPTGGRAILHTDELTYAVVGPASDPEFKGSLLESYLRLSRGLVAALAELGVGRLTRANGAAADPDLRPICFENPGPYEVLFEGRKLIGSAQVRRKGAVLQHGSLPLLGDLARISRVLRFEREAERREAARRVGGKAATLEQALGRQVSWDEAAGAFGAGFGRAMGVDLRPDELSADETERAAALEAERYSSEDWTGRL